ncbi:putative cell cycle sequence binding phosphoprotein (RBP33) [Trypanosoma grayi]|uniref:putative cell cycle sequence binding phosphoprotein (RBP33) n=1 Tax=Trypanosoma grayi TaxID=71804 RepID=UPI0004F434C1|nr:putative cell cycle sequence binding phosphoprotein (RBP33) [Trypanosoma grayi]KEG15382.1 putative cell cycle sequence binding phosphoprotein (RBP33) [Trypanosoma grayi]
MDLNSFQDVTNVAARKHGSYLQYAPQMPEDVHVANSARIEELSEKVDHIMCKVDAIYDLLVALVPQQVNTLTRTVPPVTPQTPSPDAVQPVLHDEECSVVSLLSGALHQRPDSVPLTEPPVYAQPPRGEATAIKAKDEEPRSHFRKKTPTTGPMTASAARGADTNSSPKHDCFIVLVEFKCQRVKRCESSVFIVPGQYAIVQGDRGHDCGVVNQCSEWSAEKGCFVREESFDGNVINVSRMKGDLGRVLRVATEEEVERLFGEIARNENLALKTCREIVGRLGLEMDVVDCEYQFDQQKISFYYEASRSIDFRQLNSELYRIFGVRIWLQNVNNAVKNVVPAGAMSRDDKVQYHKSGLRPPNFK